jgi:hypothetical protein
MKVTYGTDLPVTPEVAFAIVSDPSVWPSFIAGMTSAEIIDQQRCGHQAQPNAAVPC